METFFSRGQNPQIFLTHDDTEFEGHPPEDAASTEIAVQNATRTIREILTEDRRRASRRALPELAPQVPEDYLEPLPGQVWAPPRTGVRRRIVDRLKRLRGFRPNVWHAFWALAFLIVLWQPVVVLVTLFIGFWIVLLGHVVFGATRMRQLRIVIVSFMPRRWMPQRNGHDAERIHN